MKDQNPVNEKETKFEKWDRGKALFMESLLKPDSALRGCAYNQKCFNEFFSILTKCLILLKTINHLLRFMASESSSK